MNKGRGISAGQVFDAVLIVGTLYGAYRIYDYFRSATGGDAFPSGYRPGRPTLSENKLREIADRIYASAWEGFVFYEDEEDMDTALLEIPTDGDMYRLIQLYDVRGPGLGAASLNLIQTFHATHNDEELAALNAQLIAKGLTAQL